MLGDSRDWRRQLEGLSDEFTVVAWDAPGCGESSDPDPPETFGADVYADCLAEFIEALELERPHVLGLSWGGGLALELYRRRPDLPRSLVLASAYAGWAVPGRPTRWPDVRSRRCEKLTCRRSNSCRAGCRPCLRKRYHRSSPLHVAEAMHSQIAGSTLAVIPGVGHMSSVEAPDRFNAEVRTFLRAHQR